MRSFYKEFISECTEEFPGTASPTEQLAFLKERVISGYYGFEELIFAAWLDGLTPIEFLQAGRSAYEKYQEDQRATVEKQG